MKQSLMTVLLVLSLSVVAAAQSFTGSIGGRVLDPQQRAVPNATLTLKNTDTGVERGTTSNNEGDYTFAAISPGRYTVRAEAVGFAPVVAPVEVTVATALRADITLSVGGAKEIVTVAIGEGGVAVQTEQATLGTSVSSRQVLELPSVTRNPYDFVALSAGATQSNDFVVIGIAASNLRRGIGLSVNGQRSGSGNYILDGGENNDNFFGGVAQLVPLDAVQEFRVQTNNYTAEYGRSSGFIANVVTRSGANAYHGGLYWFNRNSALAANSFQNNSTGNKRPVFNRNQFGGSFAGALRKDKLFYFGSFERILVRSTAPNTFFVPTPELLAVSAPGTQAIFQKYPLPANRSNVVRARTVCPYDKVNNRPGNCPGGAGTVTVPAFVQVTRTGPQDVGAGIPQDTSLATARIDYNLSQRTQLFGRYAFSDTDERGIVLQPYSADLDQPTLTRNQNILLNLNHTWSNSFLTESRVVYNRANGPNRPLTPNPTIPAFTTIRSEEVTLPFGIDSLLGGQNLYQFFQTASWTKGNHNFRFGGQYIHQRDNRTLGSFEVAVARLNVLSEFVNGVIAQYTLAVDPKGRVSPAQVPPPFGPPSFTRHFRYNELGFFIQDTWKLTPRLTITPGLRYEYFGVLHSPQKEKQLDANFYYGQGANIFERIANGSFLRVDDAPAGYKGTFYKPDYKNFAPRLGLAWDVFGDGKTSFRSGIGVFYDRPLGQVLFSVIQNQPNYASAVLTNVPITAALLTNPYSAFPSTPVSFLNASRYLDQNLRTAYSVSWNASLERELAKHYVIGITYLGSNSSKLYAINNLNRIGSGRYLGRPGQRLFVNASGLNVRSNQGHATYHGLQVKVDSRYNEKLGLQFGTSYTWGHSIDNNSSFFADDPLTGFIGFGFTDPYAPQLDKGPSDHDVRHRSVDNFIWDIPVAKNASSWYGKYLLGGWQINGILQFQTGQPFSLFDSRASGYVGNEAPRPILAGPLPNVVSNRAQPDARTGNVFLYLPVNIATNPDGSCNPNATPFRCPPPVAGPYGGVIPRNTFRRPGVQYHNISFLKNWPIREGMRLQLRAEFYNIFNHPNLYVRSATNNIARSTFTPVGSTAAGPGVTAFFADSRQVVMALKFTF